MKNFTAVLLWFVQEVGNGRHACACAAQRATAGMWLAYISLAYRLEAGRNSLNL